MSNCIDCQDCIVVDSIPQCTTILNICDNPSLSDVTYVYIQNLATGHLNRYQSSVSGGILRIAIEQVLMPEVSYAMWINNTPNSPMNQEEVTIDGFQAYCIKFDVFRYYNMYYDGISDFEATFEVKNRE